jgi:ribonuclease HI
MSVRIWLAATHHKAFLNGGWAYVRQDGAELRGAAGGERRTTREAMAQAGLVAALKDLPKGAAVVVHAAKADADALSGMAGIKLAVVKPEPRTPLAFADAWAELASDKAKMAGAFASAIPKANLTKVLGL